VLRTKLGADISVANCRQISSRIIIFFGTRAYKTSATHQEVLLETGTVKEVSLEICAVKEVTAIPQLINKVESAVHPFPL
jgi:hypothetical protein